ncbi:armadillo-type protein [Nemania sp. FL0916]|nr:armadillo-type protein [Nemania sp. FL0916]
MSSSVVQLFNDIPDDEIQRIKALRQVADIAQNLWMTEPGSPDLDLLAEKVGDAARVEANRIPFGESGILEFFCSIVSTAGVRAPLILQCLRIIGNSSADKDENRARVLASGCLPSIVSLLNDESILAVVISVLFNISLDYEPAHRTIYEAGINPELISLLSSSRLEGEPVLVSQVCKLLGFVATQEPKANLVHPATPFVLLSLANSQPLPPDAKYFLGLTSVALIYLAQEQFQQTFLKTPGSIDLFLQTFFTACTTLNASQEGPEDEGQLKRVQIAFTASLSDLSAQPLFASLCRLEGPEVETLQRWISGTNIPLQSAACLALGNIAREDEKCTYLVQTSAIHEPLISILADPANTDAGLLHSVLGFLKNLAILPANKIILGNAGLLETHVLPRIWGIDTQTPQVQFNAVSLTRLLLVECPENVRRMCMPLSDSENSTSTTQARSKLHLLMDLNARSHQEPTQMETARATMTVCRVLHSSSGGPQSILSWMTFPDPVALPLSASLSLTDRAEAESDRYRAAFYASHDTITTAMLRLAQQSKFPVLKSELLFVFALMAGTRSGAAAVARIAEQLVPLLTEAVRSDKATTTPPPAATSTTTSELQSSSSAEEDPVAHLAAQAPVPAGSAQKTRPPPAGATTNHDYDRANALALLAGLLRWCSKEMPEAAKLALQTLLREGGRRVVPEPSDNDNDKNQLLQQVAELLREEEVVPVPVPVPGDNDKYKLLQRLVVRMREEKKKNPFDENYFIQQLTELLREEGVGPGPGDNDENKLRLARLKREERNKIYDKNYFVQQLTELLREEGRI